MAKRRATTELNHTNWDAPVEKQEAGTFEKAEKAELSTRKIISARGNRQTKTGTVGLFKSFGGVSDVSQSPVFNFGKNTTPDQNKQPENSSCKTDRAASECLVELQTLNQNLVDWIVKHIKEDPQCILSPIFSDYEKHLTDLHKKYPDFASFHFEMTEDASNSPVISGGSSDKPFIAISSTSESPLLFNAKPASTSNSLFGGALAATTNTSGLFAPLNSFSQGDKPKFSFALPPLPSTSNGDGSDSKSTSVGLPMFQFSTSVPPSFTASATATPSGTGANSGSQPRTEGDDNEEYVPPKPVVREIKEQGAVYSTRCKLFYKTDSEWRDRGVGNLFVKPLSDEKFQLLIRADTNLGNILLNIMITQEFPFRRQKNNLTFACIPSPPLSSTQPEDGDVAANQSPVPMLIRVKTEDAAVELLEEFDRRRGVK